MLHFQEENPGEFFYDPELPALWREFRQAYLPDMSKLPYNFDPDFYATMSVLSKTILVTARNHKLQGFAWMMITPLLQQSSTSCVNVNLLYLSQESRRQGMLGNGARFLLKVIDIAKSKNVDRIYIHPEVTSKMIPMLDKLGFTKESETWGLDF